MSDGTEICVTFQASFVVVTAYGLDHILSDIGEQLSWLGAACAVSNSQTQIALRSAQIMTRKEPSMLYFVITYISRPVVFEDSSGPVGSCWHGLFRNPFIVQGFPILSRPHGEQGLEIPLNMMADLGMCDRVTIFDNHLVIKGFSSMFVPTKRIKNSVQWHFIYQQDGSRISYLEADARCTVRLHIADLDATRLESSRNFVGWASSVLTQIGK